MKNHQELEFKWIKLRLYNVPIIDKQISKIAQIHNQLRNSIINGDILSVEKISLLNLSIRKRIIEIDEFYDQNCMDQRVRFLQTSRMELLRLVSIPPSTQYQKDLVPLPWKQTTKSRIKKSITPKKNVKNSPRNHLNTSQNMNKKKTFQESSFKNRSPKLKTQQNINGAEIFDSQRTKKTPVKSSRKSQFINPPTKVSHIIHNEQSKARIQQGKDQPDVQKQEINSSIKKLNDLIFTIKMTKQQYHQFVDMKDRIRNTNR